MTLTDIATHALLIDGEDVASARTRTAGTVMSMYAPEEYTAVPSR